MDEYAVWNALRDAPARRRALAVGLFILVVAAGHWWTPRGETQFLVLHVLLRKLFLLPVLLAAIWFDLRGAVIAAVVVMLVYLPHVALQWAGEWTENINQIGEIATVWTVAGIAGVLVHREKAALQGRAQAYYGTVRALVAALDTREHDTGLHSERVCAYALRIGAEIKLSHPEMRALELGALLHDIGKIGVSDAILLKPDRLTDEEWRQMREHPELGARILSATPFLGEAIEVVRFHHERFDGTGYPSGKKGAEIPLAARVFSVADVLDALTSTRPYRDPLSLSEARHEIEKGAGSHFDPRVIEAFARVPASGWQEIRGRVSNRGRTRRPPSL